MTSPTTRSLLLVEDDEILLDSERRVLEQAGWKVAAVRTAAHARRVAGLLRFDVLVTDIVLPDATGWTLAAELAARMPGLATVYASGYGEIDLVAASRLPADRRWSVLQKPFAATVLRHAAQRAFDEAAAAPM